MTINKICILHRDDLRYADMTITPAHLERIRKEVPGATLVVADKKQICMDQALDAEVLLTWGMTNPAEYCREAKALRWVHSMSAGVDRLLHTVRPEVILTCTRDIHGGPIGETVLAYILAFSRGIPTILRQQAKHQWVRYSQADEAEGKTVGIIGLGSVGRGIARKCKALGMQVLAIRKTPGTEETVDALYPPERLHYLLQQSDFVVLALPLTGETRNLIGEQELAAMKRTAYLINIARGGVVDESALVRALQEGRIAGAGLDVVAQEPLPDDSPLWDRENVIITPHMAALSPYYMDRAMEVFCENLRRLLRGEELLFVVDRSKGY
ncbi:MAG: D-2-hydroxyacid dehydrogenase [Bacillota bacterium]